MKSIFLCCKPIFENMLFPIGYCCLFSFMHAYTPSQIKLHENNLTLKVDMAISWAMYLLGR